MIHAYAIVGSDRNRSVSSPYGRPVTITIMRMRPPVSAFQVIDDVPIVDNHRILVDCARLLASRAAMCTVCGLLHKLLANGNPWLSRDPRRFPAHEEAYKTELLELLGHFPDSLRPRKAASLVVWASGKVESTAEALFLHILWASGIPRPQLQKRVTVNGHSYYLDAYWEGAALGVEIDGESKFTAEGMARFSRAIQRHEEISSTGIRLLHFTWSDLQQPDRVANAVKEALGIRRRRGTAHEYPAYRVQPRATYRTSRV